MSENTYKHENGRTVKIPREWQHIQPFTIATLKQNSFNPRNQLVVNLHRSLPSHIQSPDGILQALNATTTDEQSGEQRLANPQIMTVQHFAGTITAPNAHDWIGSLFGPGLLGKERR